MHLKKDRCYKCFDLAWRGLPEPEKRQSPEIFGHRLRSNSSTWRKTSASLKRDSCTLEKIQDTWVFEPGLRNNSYSWKETNARLFFYLNLYIWRKKSGAWLDLLDIGPRAIHPHEKRQVPEIFGPSLRSNACPWKKTGGINVLTYPEEGFLTLKKDNCLEFLDIASGATHLLEKRQVLALRGIPAS